MCYGYDDYIFKARLAEQLRKKAERAGKPKEASKPANTPAPAEPERHVKERDPVPA
jgi:hypothetical protein